MKFSGTMIEDLIATVERAEQKTQTDSVLEGEPLPVETSRMKRSYVEPSVVDTSSVETSQVEYWFASVKKSAAYESNFVGVA
jgi:hypothetical protein